MAARVSDLKRAKAQRNIGTARSSAPAPAIRPSCLLCDRMLVKNTCMYMYRICRSLTWRFRRLTDSNQVLVGLLEQLNASVSRLVVLKEIEISDRWPEVAYLLLVRLSKEPGFSRA